MRLQHSRWMRLAALWIGILALVALAAACAGDSDTNTGVAPASAEAANANTDATAGDVITTSGDAPGAAPANGLAPQATEEPPLAARVNGEPITMEAFESERNRWAMGLEFDPATQAEFDASVLEAMIDQLLITQAATTLDISISDEEVDAELALQSDLAQTNDITLEEVITAQGYTPDEYRAAVQGLLLVQKVSDVVADVPTTAPQVHSRHILVADENTARELLNQLQAGADFAQLATQYSLDTSSAATGGDLGWVARGVLLQQEVEEVIFALQPGQIAAAPVQSSLGYHIVQTLERVEDRPLTQAQVALSKQQAFLDWLDMQRQAAVIERFVGAVE